MNQTQIDRLVEIDRKSRPELHAKKQRLRTEKDTLEKEWIDLQKRAISALGKDKLKTWRTSDGVLVQVRAEDKYVTITDLSDPA